MYKHSVDVELKQVAQGIASFAIDQVDGDSGLLLVSYQGVMGRHHNLVTDNGKLKMGEVLASMKGNGDRQASDDEFMVVGQGTWSREAHESFFDGANQDAVNLGMRMEGCDVAEGSVRKSVNFDGQRLRDSVNSAMISPLVGKNDGGDIEHRFMFSFEIDQAPIRAMLTQHTNFLLEFQVSVGARKQTLVFIVNRELFNGTGFLGKLDPKVTVH
jgi:hypothetical protein